MAGQDKHPLYQRLTDAVPKARAGRNGAAFSKGARHCRYARAGKAPWNFEKFLVDRKGEVVARFAPNVEVSDPRMAKAIDKALAQG